MDARRCSRDLMLDFLAHAVLTNSCNWCFANSATYSLLWTTLSTSDFDSSTWGVHCNTLHDFVSTLTTTPGVLSNEVWFQQVLQCWGRSDPDNPGQIFQQDAAEFVSAWLQIMKSPAFDMRWERRLEMEGAVHKIDESADTLPIFLQFAPIHTHLPRCALSDLFQVWHLVDGMKAALLAAPACICVHIDRCIQDNVSNRIQRCATVIDTEVDCLVPQFLDEGMACGLVEYTIVAMQAHLGGDAHGHYRAAIRIEPTVTSGPSPSTWLISDDGKQPAPVWTLPEWMMQNVTVLWLTRTDVLSLHRYADPIAPAPDVNSMTAMLALLQPLQLPT